MRYRWRLIGILGGLLAGFGLVIGLLVFWYGQGARDLDDLANRQYKIQAQFNEAETLVYQVSRRTLEAWILNPQDRGTSLAELKSLGINFDGIWIQLKAQMQGIQRDLEAAQELFRGFSAYAKSLLARESLADLQAQGQVLLKLQENQDLLLDRIHSLARQSRREFETSLNRLQGSLIQIQGATWVLVSIGLGLGLLLVWWIPRRMSRPLEALTAAAEALSQGNRQVRIQEKFSGEMGVLAQSFNAMAQALEDDFKRLEDEVDQRKTAQHRERTLQKRLTGVLEAQVSGIGALEDRGTVTLWTRVAEEITGVPGNRILNHQIWDLIPGFESFQKEFLESQGSRRPSAPRIWVPAGPEKRSIEVVFLPFEAEDGEPGLVVRLTDITDTLKKDNQLRQLQKMDTLGTLAGGLAHDFNNILGAVSGSVSLMELYLQEGPVQAAKIQPLIETIAMATDRAAGVVRQLLSLTRAEDSQVRSSQNLIKILDQTLTMARSAFDKSIRVHWAPARDQEPWVLGDPVQLGQVFLNLVINGAHAVTLMRGPEETYGGDLSLGLKEIPGDETFCLTHPGALPGTYWCVEIQDNGVGIPEEVQKNIFDPFFTTKPQGQGTGLGLSMAYNILRNHQGFIDVYSEVGKGTVFKVFLPKVAVTRETLPSQTPIVRGAGRILVVDDEASLRFTAEKILTLAGYQVSTADNGAQALDLVAQTQGQWDLILLDLSMPGKSGRETFLDLHALWPGIPVLMTSGFPGDLRFQGLRELGLQGILGKPFYMDTLTKAVAEVLKKRSGGS